MTRDDWKGIGVSFGLHLFLLVAFALIGSTTQTQPLGMIEVEFGPFETADAAALAPEPQPATEAPDPQPLPQEEEALPPETEPVNIPETPQPPQPEQIPPPQPEPEPEPEAQPEEQATETEDTEQTGGTPEGGTGAAADMGQVGDDASDRAPFSVEGLNRMPLVFPLPRNPGGYGTSVTEVCVAPDGRVISAHPAQRTGTPALDNAALQAVRQWRFNSLPPDAPQDRQCGRVTFRFTVN